MPAARFDHAGGSVIFSRNPLRPVVGVDLLQASASSTGGVRFGYDSHALQRPISLRWKGLSSADLSALETFIYTTVNGMAETFDYTDADGLVRRVRLSSPTIDSSEIASGRHDVALELLGGL